MRTACEAYFCGLGLVTSHAYAQMASSATLFENVPNGSGSAKTILMLELSGCGNCIETLKAVKTYKERHSDTQVVVLNKSRFGQYLSELKTIPELAPLIPLTNILENASAFPILVSLQNRVKTNAGPKLAFNFVGGRQDLNGIEALLSGRHYHPNDSMYVASLRNLLGLGYFGGKNTRRRRSSARRASRKSARRSSVRRSRLSRRSKSGSRRA